MTQVAFIANDLLQDNKLFDVASSRDNCLERFVLLRKKLEHHSIQCDTLDVCEALSITVLILSDISSTMRQVIKAIKQSPNLKILYIPTEPPVISCLHEDDVLIAMPFDKVLFWNDNVAARCTHVHKCNIGQPVIDSEAIPLIRYKDKKFLVAITSSKLIKHKNGIHYERFQAFDFFSETEEGIDLYGVGWECTNYPFVKKSYRGMCDSKKEVLKNYKFSICFENAKNYPGLITEKIFDCFAAGVVPIYYGPPNVEKYIPKECFINFLNFSNYDELYNFLVSMDEQTYQSYLDAVKAFLQTPEYYEFTSKRFAEIVCSEIQVLMREAAPHRTVFGFKWALLKIILKHPFLFLKNFKSCRRFLFDMVIVW